MTDPTPGYNTPIPPSILTPDAVSSPIGELTFFDGVPTPETVQLVYDNLDRMRGVEAFLNGIPGASIYAMYRGAAGLGATDNSHVVLTENLLDSTPLFLTANTSTLYVTYFINTKEDGPVVVDVPQGMLGAFNDMWFRYVADVGPAGADRGQGGRYLVLPPDYEGAVPAGYFVVRPRSYRTWLFMRGSLADGLEAAVANVRQNFRACALADQNDPPPMTFINGSGQPMISASTRKSTP
jgi:hypothetical protein